MEKVRNLGPLTAQVQKWWSAQHANCHAPVANDPLGRPFEGLSFLYSHEEIQVDSIICPTTCGWRSDKDSHELLASLLPEVKAGAVRVAGQLSQPDMQVAQQVAFALVPTPYGQELTLVSDLIQAAGAQSVFERNRALKGAGFAAVAIAGFWFIGPGNRSAA